MDDDEAALAAAFDDADELELPPKDEWPSYNLTDVSQGNRALRLLRRMRRNRQAVMAVAQVDYDRIEKVYREKRAEVDQFVGDRLGAQDEAEPMLERWVIGLAAREMDERLAEDPKASKTVHFVKASVASRAVGGQPEVVNRDEWLPWAVDHDEVDDGSPCTLAWFELAHVDSLLSRFDELIVSASAAAEVDGSNDELPSYIAMRARIEQAQKAIALAQAKGAKPLFAKWADRYYWFSGQEALVDPETGDVIEAGVPAAWYPKGELQPYPVPGVGRREPGRNYDLHVED